MIKLSIATNRLFISMNKLSISTNKCHMKCSLLCLFKTGSQIQCVSHVGLQWERGLFHLNGTSWINKGLKRWVSWHHGWNVSIKHVICEQPTLSGCFLFILNVLFWFSSCTTFGYVICIDGDCGWIYNAKYILKASRHIRSTTTGVQRWWCTCVVLLCTGVCFQGRLN